MKIKITVATVIWNPGKLLERTLRSVKEQDYREVEHLFIDGCSNDGTLERLNLYKEENLRHQVTLLSEPDRGLYDAMNKALRLASGDYILFLNAGDSFHSSQTLSQVARAAQQPTLPAVIYGNTNIVDGDGRFLRPRHKQPPVELTWRSFEKGMLVCHQAFFARTDLARQTPYNLRYRFSADFDWCIRLMKQAEKENLLLKDAGIIVADYLEEGMTTRNHKKSLIERFRIMVQHYGWPKTILNHLRFLLKSPKGH